MNTPTNTTDSITQILTTMAPIPYSEAMSLSSGLVTSIGRGLTRVSFGAQWRSGLFEGDGTGGFTSATVVVAIGTTGEFIDKLIAWANKFARVTGTTCIVGPTNVVIIIPVNDDKLYRVPWAMLESRHANKA